MPASKNYKVKISHPNWEADAEVCLGAAAAVAAATAQGREIGSSIAACATFHVVGENYDVRPTAPTFRPSLPLPSRRWTLKVLDRLVANAQAVEKRTSEPLLYRDRHQDVAQEMEEN